MGEGGFEASEVGKEVEAALLAIVALLAAWSAQLLSFPRPV